MNRTWSLSNVSSPKGSGLSPLSASGGLFRSNRNRVRTQSEERVIRVKPACENDEKASSNSSRRASQDDLRKQGGGSLPPGSPVMRSRGGTWRGGGDNHGGGVADSKPGQGRMPGNRGSAIAWGDSPKVATTPSPVTSPQWRSRSGPGSPTSTQGSYYGTPNTSSPMQSSSMWSDAGWKLGGGTGGTPDANNLAGQIPGVVGDFCGGDFNHSPSPAVGSSCTRSRPSPGGALITPSGITVLGSLDVEEEEWARYVASLNILDLPDDAVAVPLLVEALCAAPVPSPWLLCRSPDGDLFFANETTRESSFQHPFHSSVAELARICPTLLGLPLGPRRALTRGLRDAWDQQAQHEFRLWLRAQAEGGEEYFYHCETMAVMWESPLDIILPALDLKMRAIERIEDDIYIMRIFADHRAEVRDSAELVRERVGSTLASHKQALADLQSDECEWIRKAATEALVHLEKPPSAAPRSPNTTTSSWFSAHSVQSKLTVQSVRTQ